MKIILRPAVSTDHAFVYATYIRGKWFDRDNKTTLKRSTWSALQHQRLEMVLTGSQAIPVTVACLDEDPDTILGYGFQDGEEYYTYVKLAFRSPGLNVKERLLEAAKHE